MKKYEILPHPAELRIKIYGKTLEELFQNAAEAMADILKHNAKLRMDANAAKKEIIKVQSPDINSLLVDFLSEILAKSQINKQVYKVIKLEVYKEKSQLEGEITGTPVKRFDEDIKAITYEDLDIEKIKGVWRTDLVLDV